jgi:hypothetical protein
VGVDHSGSGLVAQSALLRADEGLLRQDLEHGRLQRGEVSAAAGGERKYWPIMAEALLPGPPRETWQTE